jgi:hypothetical protein
MAYDPYGSNTGYQNNSRGSQGRSTTVDVTAGGNPGPNAWQQSYQQQGYPAYAQPFYNAQQANNQGYWAEGADTDAFKAQSGMMGMGNQMMNNASLGSMYQQYTAAMPTDEGGQPIYEWSRDMMQEALEDRQRNIGTLIATGQHYADPAQLAEAQKAFSAASTNAANEIANRDRKFVTYDDKSMDPWRPDEISPEIMQQKMELYGNPMMEQMARLGARTGNVGAMGKMGAQNMGNLYQKLYMGERGMQEQQRSRALQALGQQRGYQSSWEQNQDMALMRQAAMLGGNVDMYSADRNAALQAQGMPSQGGGAPGVGDYLLGGANAAANVVGQQQW